MNRCYGNPVPRRNANDNSTDMSSFPFVRHHFLRAGFEVIDCPPLTAQLKNSADIRMVMDIRDLLLHDTYFDEFIILSGDADFTPVLIRLRAHARRTVVFANDFTAAPYTAICDGEIREAALIELILAGELPEGGPSDAAAAAASPPKGRIEEARREILAEVIAGVRASATPVPLEALADRALRALGHEKTIATGWAGAGSFRELLRRSLPDEIRLTDDPPYLAFDARRHAEKSTLEAALAARAAGVEAGPAVAPAAARQAATESASAPVLRPAQADGSATQRGETADGASKGPVLQQAPAGPRSELPAQRRPDVHSAIQQSIARIHEACQAPPLAPQEYRLLFEIMAREISDNDLTGVQTLANIADKAREHGIEVRRDDVRFVLEVVSEADPWFEQGASADVFAARFRNFVVARCRGQGLVLSANEFELIDAWFGAGLSPARLGNSTTARLAPPAVPGAAEAATPPPLPALEARGGHFRSLDDARAHNLERRGTTRDEAETATAGEELLRVARTRLRG
jgi:hypothetical protein